jgi:DNA primase
MEIEAVAAVVGGASDDDRAIPRQGRAAASRPDPRDPVHQVEREALKLAIQRPDLGAEAFAEITADLFRAPAYAAVREAVTVAGGTAGVTPGGEWVARLRDAASNDEVRSLVTELAVEPLRHDGEADERYADAVYARLLELATTRRIAELKSKLQRLSPVEATTAYNRLFGELVALESHRRGLRERAIGGL